MTDTVHLLVHVPVRPDRVAEFARLARAHAACSRLEPGCLRFDVLRDPADPCAWTLSEEFRDGAALDAHRATAHYARWREAVAALEAVPRRRRELAAAGGKLLDPAWLPCLGGAARVGRATLALANGIWDGCHPGHVHLLRAARAMSGVLVVAVDTDEGARALKGPGRPVNGLAARVAALEALACVSHVVTFTGEEELLSLLAALKPDMLVKGEEERPGGVVGAGLVKSYGGRVVLVPRLPGYSTTALLAVLAAAKSCVNP